MLPVVKAMIVISSAGSSFSKPQRGFTLLELLVVLALAASLMAIVPPLISNSVPGVELKATARKLASGLRYARNHSVATRKQSLLTLDLKARKFMVSGRKRSYVIPEDVEVELFAAAVEMESDTRGSIRFFPTGGSTGGRITLSVGERKYEVDVDWLTGKVRILEPSS